MLQNSHKQSDSFLLVMSICFLVFNSFLYYPQTNFLTDLCSIIGAITGLYYFSQRLKFNNSQNLFISILAVLILWIIFHLFFLSHNFISQFREFDSIWKRVTVATIFGFGFGFALVLSKSKSRYWYIFYLGMMGPSIVFIIKYLLQHVALLNNWVLPDFIRLFPGRDSVFYLYKVDYVSFCLPALALNFSEIKNQISQKFELKNIMYYFSVILILFTFEIQSIKNGVAHSFILMVIFFVIAGYSFAKKSIFIKSNIKKSQHFWIGTFLIGVLVLLMVISNVKNNPSWKTLYEDAKIGVQTSKFDHWKYWGAKGYPLNAYGKEVAPTNYERVAWAIISVQLLAENPFGYGLIERSFGALTKLKWPDSTLDQAHSGWIDLALGIGLPGVGLILVLLFTGLWRLLKLSRSSMNIGNQIQVWTQRCAWILLSITLFWCTTEISLKAHFISLMFWISFSYGILSGSSHVDIAKSKY